MKRISTGEGADTGDNVKLSPSRHCSSLEVAGGLKKNHKHCGMLECL